MPSAHLLRYSGPVCCVWPNCAAVSRLTLYLIWLHSWNLCSKCWRMTCLSGGDTQSILARVCIDDCPVVSGQVNLLVRQVGFACTYRSLSECLKPVKASIVEVQLLKPLKYNFCDFKWPVIVNMKRLFLWSHFPCNFCNTCLYCYRQCGKILKPFVTCLSHINFQLCQVCQPLVNWWGNDVKFPYFLRLQTSKWPVSCQKGPLKKILTGRPENM